MTKTALLGIVAAALVAVCIAPAAALAGGGRGGHHHHGPRLRSELPKRVFPDRHFHGHRPFHGHRGFGHKGFGHNGGFGFYGAPVITYVPSYTPTYIPPPPAYNPDYSYEPVQRVVEFASGRYVLYGDGVTTAYRWVWIPNPPASPPVEEPPVAPPPPPAAAPPPAPEPAVTTAEPPRRTDVYRWTDEAGVVHLTDRLDRVPEAYRSKVSKSVSVTKGQQ
jgi:hypothetical protein